MDQYNVHFLYRKSLVTAERYIKRVQIALCYGVNVHRRVKAVTHPHLSYLTDEKSFDLDRVNVGSLYLG